MTIAHRPLPKTQTKGAGVPGEAGACLQMSWSESERKPRGLLSVPGEGREPPESAKLSSLSRLTKITELRVHIVRSDGLRHS